MPDSDNGGGYVRTCVSLPRDVADWLRQEAAARARAHGCSPSVSALVARLAQRERAAASAGAPAMTAEV